MINEISGHKKEDCDGKWIDTGTLMNPRDQMCAKCRGHRSKPMFEEPEPVSVFGEEETAPRYSRSMQMVGYLLLGAAIIGAIVAFFITC